MKAESHRAAQPSANIEVCSVSLNNFEAVLAPLATSSQNDFVVALETYFIIAIAHFLGSRTPVRPPLWQRIFGQ